MARAELLRRIDEIAAMPPAERMPAESEPTLPARDLLVISPHRLRAQFVDGSTTEADLAGFVHQRQALAALREPAAFATARLVDGGNAIRFLDLEELEIGIDVLPAIAARQAPMTGADFAAWMRRHRLSANSAADVLGLARRTVVGYKSLPTVPPVVAVACRAFDTDRALLPALLRPRRPGRQARKAAGEAA